MGGRRREVSSGGLPQVVDSRGAARGGSIGLRVREVVGRWQVECPARDGVLEGPGEGLSRSRRAQLRARRRLLVLCESAAFRAVGGSVGLLVAGHAVVVSPLGRHVDYCVVVGSLMDGRP
jgi:hypothetical protein